jgi:type IV pilus assembly protein PilZ
MAADTQERKYPRVELILKITYTDKQDFLADYAANSSRGGLFIVTNKHFDIGEEIAFSISFPGLLYPVQCRGKVCWHLSPEEAGEGKRAGIGVCLLDEVGEKSDHILSVLSEMEKTQDPAQADAPEIDDPIGPFRVLLADHDQQARNMVKFALEKHHRVRMASGTRLEVEVADDSSRAWSLLKSTPFDLAVIDLEIPDQDGRQLITQIREDNHLVDLPIIAIGEENPVTKMHANEAGADFFMEKPVMLTQLLDSLQMLLNAKSA